MATRKNSPLVKGAMDRLNAAKWENLHKERESVFAWTCDNCGTGFPKVYRICPSCETWNLEALHEEAERGE